MYWKRHILYMVVIFYLPPFHLEEPDDDWHQQVDDLESEILKISAAGGRTLASGDANVQPPSLGGGESLPPARGRRWATLMSSTGLVLRNPHLTGMMPVQVQLPSRGRAIHIRPGDTHHHCQGRGSAIDLVGTTDGLDATMVVHNSIHCATTKVGEDASCPLPNCQEYTGGDHFLVQILLYSMVLCSAVPATVGVVPATFHHPSQWRSALSHGADVFTRLQSIAHLLSESLLSQAVSRPPNGLRQWLADATALTLGIAEGLARDGWLFTRSKPGAAHSNKNRANASGRNLEDEIRDCTNGAAWPDAALSTCFRWLRPTDPPIPSRFIIDGHIQSLEVSHSAWCERLRAQSTWHHDYNKQVDVQVKQASAWVVANATVHIGKGPDDYPVTEPETRHVISTWDPSRATTPDLLTRAAFLADPSDWSCVCWSIQRLVGPGCLACRPAIWRWRSYR